MLLQLPHLVSASSSDLAACPEHLGRGSACSTLSLLEGAGSPMGVVNKMGLDVRRMAEMMEAAMLRKRQFVGEGPGVQNGNGEVVRDGWWFSETAYIVKWAIVGAM